MLTHYFIHFLGLFKFIIVPALFFSPFAFTQTWTGAVSSNWNDAANWTSWPLDGADIVIDFNTYGSTGNHPQLFVNSAFIPANVGLQNGAQLIIAANLTVEEDFEIIGDGTAVTINGGIISIGPGNEGRLIADLGGTLIINSGTVTAEERLISGEDATIIINGGNVTAGERLLLDLGGHIIQNAGTINVGEVLALADGNANGSCYFEKHGGTLNVNGEMALENEAGDFEPTFFMDAGTFNMNGDVNWFGEAPGTGNPRMIISGGMFVLAGNIGNLELSTVNMDLEIRDSALVYFEGSTVTLFPADSVKQVNNNDLHLDNVSFLNEGVIHCTASRIINSGDVSVTGSGITTLSSLYIVTGAAFINAGEFGVAITGDLINDGEMLNDTNRVTFNGGGSQQIRGTENVTFYDLFIDQSSTLGISYFIDLAVTHQLNLMGGVLFSQHGSMVTLSDNATSTEGHEGSYIAGPVKKTGNDPFAFPVGKGDRWMRFAMSAPASPGAQVTVEYYDDPFADFTSVDPPLTAVSPFEHWSVDAINTGALDIVLYWEDALSSGILSCDDLTIAGWDGNSWKAVPSNAVGPCSGTTNGFVLTSSPAVMLSNYTFGFFNDVTTQQLELCKGDSVFVVDGYYNLDGNYVDSMGTTTILTHIDLIGPVVLEQTATLCYGDSILVGTEYYNLPGLYEDTLSAFNGCDSIVKTLVNVIAPVDLAVEVSQTTLLVNGIYDSYQWINCENEQPIPGEANYWFTPAEDGSYAAIINNGPCADTTECVTIAGLGMTENGTNEIQFYPNPTNGEIQFTLPDGITAMIEIHDYTGKMLYSEYITGNERINLSGQVTTGVYLLTITSADGLKTSHRLIIAVA